MEDIGDRKVPYKVKDCKFKKGCKNYLELTLNEIKKGLDNLEAQVFKDISDYLSNIEDGKNFKVRDVKKPYDYCVYRNAVNKHILKDNLNKNFIDGSDNKNHWIVGKGTKVYRIVAETWLEQTKDNNNVKRNTVHHIYNKGLGPEVKNLIWLTEEEHNFIHRKH